MAKKLATIAKQLVSKNAQITTVIENNPGTSYKALEPHITAKLCSLIGQKEDQFVKRNELIWACINHVEGTEEELDY